MLRGKKMSVLPKTHRAVKNTASFGTPSALQDTMLSDAVSALPTVPLDGLILEYHARRTLTEELQENP